MMRKRSQSWRDTLSRTLDRTYGNERAEEHEQKKLTISTPRSNFQHLAHIGINGESFGNIQSLKSADAPEVVKKALTLNNQSGRDATLSTKKKSPILQISKTIIRPDRPNILRRRADSDSESDGEDSVVKEDHSDLMECVLAVMDRGSTNQMSTVDEEDFDEDVSVDSDLSVQEEDITSPAKASIKGKSINDPESSFMAITNYNDMAPKRTSTVMIPSTDSEYSDKTYSSESHTETEHELRERRLAAVIDRFRSDVDKSTVSETNSTLPSDEEGEFVVEEESFISNNFDDQPIVTLRGERSRASRNQEKRSSTIDQIKNKELQIIGASKKGSIHSTDREVML